AERLADHVVIVSAGRAVAAGSPAALTRDDVVVVRFTAVPGLAVAELAARLGAKVAETGPGHYAVEGAPPQAALAAVTAWRAEQGVLPEHLSTGRRSLEDVFLELTT